MEAATQITNDILAKVCTKLPNDSLITLQLAIATTLENYEITTKECAITIYGQESYKPLLDYFCMFKRMQNIKESTLELYTYELTRLFEFCNKPITKITSNDLMSYLVWRKANTKKEKGLTTTYTDFIRRAFNSFFLLVC